MKQKGFTLIELMIALAIFSIISLFLYQIFFSQIRQSFNFKDNIDIQQNINKAMTMLTDEIRNNSFTNITVKQVGGAAQVLSNDKVIIDLGSDSSTSEVYYNSTNRTLSDNNGNQCFNIDSIKISSGVTSGENELILIIVSVSEGKSQLTTSTAINVKR